nr:hypothetical protein [Flavobacterium sp. ASV13]
MKISIQYLIYFFFIFHFSQGQILEKSQTKISIIKDSIKCKNEGTSTFVFPDILGKNENNFFNTIIANDYISYLETKKILKNPKQIVNEAIKLKETNCENDNFSGLINTSCIIYINNSNLLSIIMNYESLAGNLNLDMYYYNFDIKNSQILNYKDVFKERKINVLISFCNKILKNRLKDLYKEEKENRNNLDIYNSLVNTKVVFNHDSLSSFIIHEKGIEIIYNYGFNKGETDIENNLFFSFKELESFLKDDFKVKIK